MARGITVNVHVDDLLCKAIDRWKSSMPDVIAAALADGSRVISGGDFLNGRISTRGKRYFVGRGHVDDRGFEFEFNDSDEEAAPFIRASDRVTTCGREWMRKHAPRQWAAFCAARMLNRADVDIVGDAFATQPLTMSKEGVVRSVSGRDMQPRILESDLEFS